MNLGTRAKAVPSHAMVVHVTPSVPVSGWEYSVNYAKCRCGPGSLPAEAIRLTQKLVGAAEYISAIMLRENRKL